MSRFQRRTDVPISLIAIASSQGSRANFGPSQLAKQSAVLVASLLPWGLFPPRLQKPLSAETGHLLKVAKGSKQSVHSLNVPAGKLPVAGEPKGRLSDGSPSQRTAHCNRSLYAAMSSPFVKGKSLANNHYMTHHGIGPTHRRLLYPMYKCGSPSNYDGLRGPHSQELGDNPEMGGRREVL